MHSFGGCLVAIAQASLSDYVQRFSYLPRLWIVGIHFATEGLILRSGLLHNFIMFIF